MLRGVRWVVPFLGVLVPLAANAQDCAPPIAPPPVVSYYAAPAPAVAYYAAPAPVYAAAGPVSVSTYRYGLFGRRSLTTVRYGAPVPVVAAPAPVATVSSYYYAPAPVVQPAYYGPVYRVP